MAVCPPRPAEGCRLCGGPLPPARDESRLSAGYDERCAVCHGVARARHSPGSVRATVWHATATSQHSERPASYFVLCAACFERSYVPAVNQASACSACGEIAVACHRLLLTAADGARSARYACSGEHLAYLLASLQARREGWCARCDSEAAGARLLVSTLLLAPAEGYFSFCALREPRWRWRESALAL